MSTQTVPEQGSSPKRGEEQLVLRLGQPEELLAAVPFLLGFHPSESLVVVGLKGSRQRSCFTGRVDLPSSPDDLRSTTGQAQRGDEGELVSWLAQHVVAVGAESALLVAYSDDAARATRAITVTREVLEKHEVKVFEALRVDGTRWWSYLCTEPACCPPEGRPYDLSANRVTTEAVFAGRIAYADREEVRALVRPLLGKTRKAMQEATDWAEDAVSQMWTRALEKVANPCGVAPDPWGAGTTPRDTVVTEAGSTVRTLVRRHVHSPGLCLSDDEAATLSVFVGNIAIRDVAWMEMSRETAEQHIELWRRVTQRAVPPYEVAPATLLAFAAWLGDQPVLARCALERAYAGDRGYSMARLVDQLLSSGVRPSPWTPMKH